MQPVSSLYRWDFTCGVRYGALQTPILNQTQTECLEELSMPIVRWLLYGKKVFRDVRVPTVALREKSFLQRSKSVTLVMFSSGKLFWSSGDQLIFCCGHALTEMWSMALRATTAFSLPFFIINCYFFDLFSLFLPCSKINVTWKTDFISVKGLLRNFSCCSSV